MRLLENIPESWQKEDGRKGPISVCRPDQQGSYALPLGVSIGEFLSYKTNQKGTWLFDVGQGFPPGWRAFSWRHGRWVDLGFGIPQDFVENPEETFHRGGPEQPYAAHGTKAMIKDAITNRNTTMTERVEMMLSVDDDTAEFLRGVAELSTVSLDDVVSVMLAAYLKRLDSAPNNEELTRRIAAKDKEIAHAHTRIRELDNDLMARGSDVVRMTRELECKDEEIAAADGKIAKLEEDNAYLRLAIKNYVTAKQPAQPPVAADPAFHVEQIRAAAHAEFMDMREDNVSPMKFVRAVLKRLTGEEA